MTERFDCCFENDYKGIYFEVKKEETHIDISFFNKNEFVQSICLRDDDVGRLIDTLKNYKK